MKPMKVISSAEQLAVDTSFIAGVEMNRKVTSILFEKMRLLGSNPARKQQASNIAQLISEVSSHNTATALAREFGFASEQNFEISLIVLFKRKAELKNRYSNYDAIDGKLYAKAYSIVVKNAEKRSAKAPVLSIIDICEECFFNNCSECLPDDSLTDPYGDPNSSPGGGGGIKCREACSAARMNSRNLAEMELWGELGLVCPGAFNSVQEFLIARGQANNAPIGGGLALIACGTLAYARYINNISLAENNYITCLNGCK